MTVVDSTFATPIVQQPLAYGVDLVVHSATKGIAGHNDATLGVVAGSRELLDWLWGFAVLQGANASPYDALNGLRGLRTLPVRLRQQSETAQRLAEVLEGARRGRARCAIPGLASHPQRAHRGEADGAARRAAVASTSAGGLEAGRRFVESVQHRAAGAVARRPGDARDPPGVDHPREPHARASSRPTASARARSGSRSASSTPTTSIADFVQALAVE